MKVLIVHAHPEPKSFNAAMTNQAANVLNERGHEVRVSDLYKIKFKAVCDRSDFTSLVNDKHLDYVREQKNASVHDSFSVDIKSEQEKVLWADLMIFQFPIWWFSAPAILKGWFDRVLAAGFAWDFERTYKNGMLSGKKAMLSVTTGGYETAYSKTGANGIDMPHILYPIRHGILNFCGIEVVRHFTAYAVEHVEESVRIQYLEDYRNRLENLEREPVITYLV